MFHLATLSEAIVWFPLDRVYFADVSFGWNRTLQTIFFFWGGGGVLLASSTWIAAYILDLIFVLDHGQPSTDREHMLCTWILGLATWSSGIVSAWGVMGREIESRQGIGWWFKIQKVCIVLYVRIWEKWIHQFFLKETLPCLVAKRFDPSTLLSESHANQTSLFICKSQLCTSPFLYASILRNWRE
jgi:hypothetical protein